MDLNRQSLDRVVPNIAAGRLQGMFASAGWQVLTVKYGQLLEELFTRPGGEELRARIDAMPNQEYQRLLRCDAAQLGERLPGGARRCAALVATLDDGTLTAAVRNLGGHDLAALDRAYRAIDDTRPTIIFAYTIKGYGLPIEGHPQNHSALLTRPQFEELAAVSAPTRASRGSPSIPAATRDGCAPRPRGGCAGPRSPPARSPGAARRTSAAPRPAPRPLRPRSGRVLLDLTRQAPEAPPGAS